MRGVAVVTGGSAGIGLATAQEFARRGRPVAILARGKPRLAAAEAALRRHGAPVLAISADAADAEAVEAAAERIERALGPIGVWVNNAMSTVLAPADRVTAHEYRRVTETTYLSQVYGTLAALRRMKPRGRGAIIQVSSGLAIRAAPLQAPYCAAKFAVTGFTDALRAELIHDRVGVSLSVIYLPAVNTPQFDWARNRMRRRQRAPDPVFDPRLCAEAILHAADHRDRDVWVGRSVLVMAAAQTLAPGFADRKAAQAWESQLGASTGRTVTGNLDAPAPGPARIDGRFARRAKATRSEFWTSGQRDLAVLALCGGALLGAAALARLALPARRDAPCGRERAAP